MSNTVDFRGDVTYMLPICNVHSPSCLVIVTLIRGVLQWGTTLLPQYSFLTVGLWEAIVAFGVFSSIVMVVSAFRLLLNNRFQPVDRDAIRTSGSSKTPAVIALTVRIYTHLFTVP